MKKMIIASIACALCASFTLLSACNTVKGVGQDTKQVGQGIKNVAS